MKDDNLLKHRKHIKLNNSTAPGKRIDDNKNKVLKEENVCEDKVAPVDEASQINNKLGPLPTFPRQRFWTRLVLILGTLVVVYFTSGKERIVNIAKFNEILNNRQQDVKCSKEYFEDVYDFPGCIPIKCGRFISDTLITSEEVKHLLVLADRGLSMGGSAGGASILDLHSGALSKEKHFINLYQINSTIFNENDFNIYIRVRKKIQAAVATIFQIQSEKLYLTKPTFFSRLTSNEPATSHDEYWHPHVDKETYPSFHYTSLLYLSDYQLEFKGGRFIFDDAENLSTIVEPKQGRVLIFTSGKENLHHVERVKSGIRFAITVSFTCDPQLAILDPSV